LPDGLKPPQEEVSVAELELSKLIMKLELATRWSDRKVSREAFLVLINTFHKLFHWLHLACLPEVTFGTLTRRAPEGEALSIYAGGDHLAGWGGVEFARLYKQFKAELTSRSKRSSNPLSHALFGIQIGDRTSSPNPWFRAEFVRKSDYRPTGPMAIWVARQIRDVWRLKENRSYWRPLVALAASATAESIDIEKKLKIWAHSQVVEGQEPLSHVDKLPMFSSGDEEDIRAWRSFIRSRLLIGKKSASSTSCSPTGTRNSME